MFFYYLVNNKNFCLSRFSNQYFGLVRVLINSIFLFLLIGCNKEKKVPAGIPENANYNKRTNLYSFYKDNKNYLYSESGKIFSECETNSNKESEGLCKTFSVTNGEMLSYGMMKKNPTKGQTYKDGIWIWKFVGGQIYYKQSFAFDKIKALWIETNLLGNEHGPYERYYEDGKLEEIGVFDTGKKNGEWIKYYRNSIVEYKGTYRSDKKIGLWKYFYPNGKIEIEELYSDKFKLISRKTFFLDGTPNCKIENEIANYSCASL